jgi:hypothetical protein
MTPSNSPAHPVDLDLLADYAAGLLADSDAELAATWIATDPVWATAYADLTAALPALHDRLRDTGGDDLGLPADVEARLTAALRAEAAAGRRPVARGRHDSPTRPANVPVGGRPARSARRRTRGLKIFAGVVAAVAIAGFFGIGLLAVQQGTTGKSSTAAGGAGAPAAANAAPAAGVVPITATGNDYTAATLGSVRYGQDAILPTPMRPASSPDVAGGATDKTLYIDQINRCLAALRRTDGGTPLEVDIARYDGVAAFIVTLTDPNLIVATATSCGTDPDNPRILASVPWPR